MEFFWLDGGFSYTFLKWTVHPAILKINACCLTLAISYFVLFSQPLFVPCFFEKRTLRRQVFIFKIAGVHSPLARSVGSIKLHTVVLTDHRNAMPRYPQNRKLLDSQSKTGFPCNAYVDQDGQIFWKVIKIKNVTQPKRFSSAFSSIILKTFCVLSKTLFLCKHLLYSIKSVRVPWNVWGQLNNRIISWSSRKGFVTSFL